MIYGDQFKVSVDTILPCENYTFRPGIDMVYYTEYWRESRNAYIQDLGQLVHDGVLTKERHQIILEHQIKLYRFWFQIQRDRPDPFSAKLERQAFFNDHLTNLGLLDNE